MPTLGKTVQQISPIMLPASGTNHDWTDIIQVDKFGANPDVDTGTDPEDIWDQGGTYTFLSSAATLYASSSSADDSVEMTVQGLDANWAAQTATVTLNGQTQAEIGSSVTWMRVFRAYNSSDTDLVGNVYIAEAAGEDITAGVPDTASEIKAKVQSTKQQTLMAIYTVPTGYTAYLTRWYCSQALPKSSTAIIELQVREFGGIFRVKRHFGLSSAGSTWIEETPPIAYRYPAKSDIKVVAFEVGANDQDIAAGFDLLCVKNSS